MSTYTYVGKYEHLRSKKITSSYKLCKPFKPNSNGYRAATEHKQVYISRKYCTSSVHHTLIQDCEVFIWPPQLVG